MTRAKGFETPLCSDAPIFSGYLNNIVETAPIPALADLAGDARPEIVVPSGDGKIRAYSPDGAELWKYTYDVAGEPWIMASEAAIGDLSKDGKPEIVFTTYSVDHFVSHLTILDAAGRMQRKVTLDKRGAMGAPTLADVDGDGKLDIVISLKDVVGGDKGGVQIWTVESAGNAQPTWPTGRGNFLRTGRWGGPAGSTAILRIGQGRLRAWERRGKSGVNEPGIPRFDVLGIRNRARRPRSSQAAPVPGIRAASRRDDRLPEPVGATIDSDGFRSGDGVALPQHPAMVDLVRHQVGMQLPHREQDAVGDPAPIHRFRRQGFHQPFGEARRPPVAAHQVRLADAVMPGVGGPDILLRHRDGQGVAAAEGEDAEKDDDV